ncbi:MAG: peptidoglycan DD-metalloendopeptidase family protein [Deltaproteobacteria bacterium]|nr:peptidoglycan DD-metalloendopeptidase family protein [Deltaproteobacteria bacterium]
MARKDWTFLIIPECTSRVKQFKFSRFWFRFAVCFFIIASIGTCYVFLDYGRMKISRTGSDFLQGEIETQRSQIQAFSEEINTLKQDMLQLRKLDEKIRIIANIDKPRDKQAIFGVGGSLPDDLDADLPLTKKHNALVRDMHEQLEHLKVASDLQTKSFQDIVVSLENQRSLLAATPSVRPTVGWVSSRFGYRTSPFTGRREFHKGLDIAARAGTPIVAPASGVVTFVGKKGAYGLMAIINHGHGVVTRYGHLKKCTVKRGSRVKRGDKIALLGNSGRSTGPHLHYEVNVNGIPINPQKYILD